MRPADPRCEAKKGKGRCKNDKSFDTESGNWLRWCDEHEAVEAAARTEGGARVERFVEESNDANDEDE